MNTESFKGHTPGHQYVGVRFDAYGEGQHEFGNLYWYASDGNFYADGGFLSDDSTEPTDVWKFYDEMREIPCVFDAEYVS